ncbi:gliding motility-associated C-terminal domain-containing protein [Hymenobacter sp.]|uniref:DUF7948 domain-containing protein n=1 Tax=Hymenobacter sp. TaxID=1898978 RepID=UPI00286B2D71|nr:gliding motility-associated C-terminal domain-containing protein [Hymenobacter sp.]
MTFSTRLALLLGLWAATGTAQAAALPPAAPLPFVANKGQWDKQVKFSVAIPGGRLFLEKNCFTYNLFPAALPGAPESAAFRTVASHAFRVTLVGAASGPMLTGEEPQQAYHNYFLGNDPARWAARVPLFAGVRYRSAYPGVDVRWHQQGTGQLEYDFEVAPGARPAGIRLRYDGLDGVSLTPEGHLRLRTSVGELREQAPVAWQVSAAGERRAVPCRFVLRGQEVSFSLGAGYNPAQRLVIDPVLVFATYSGSPAGMSANTAAADAQGNMYTGGQLFGGNYPVTLGAFKTNYNAGNMGIAKLSANGASLLYATYLGGTNSAGAGQDYPLDMEVNAAGELLLLGSTSAADYPITAGAFDRQLSAGSGGPFSARDLVVTRFNASGTALLASTYLGGSGEEAGSVSSVPGSLTLDPTTGDVLVVSSTLSTDYPVLNAAQAASLGSQEGVLTRLNLGLTALRWSTYLGGTGADRAHDVKVAPNGDVYVCGSTTSTGLALGTPGILPVAPGGINGFVMRYSPAGARLAGTYLGTAARDVARFLDIAANGQVLVGGASDGPYPRTAGTYAAVVPGTMGFFVHGLSPALNATVFSTQVSVVSTLSQPLTSNILTGFGRDDCGRLYFSTYAGAIASPGCPRTADAFSSQPRSLYLAVLAENATALLYGTYVGEVNSNQGTSGGTHTHFAASNHVSRAGVLYHLTCSSGRTFGTTPGAYSAGATGGLDGAAFKFNMAPSANSSIQLAVVPPPAGCAPYAVQFNNTTGGALLYSWDFGDGSPLDTAKAPLHTYAVAGTYTARLVATRRLNVAGCGPGTVALDVPVAVEAPAPARVVADSLGCGRALVLDPARLVPTVSGSAFRWSTGAQTPTVAVTTPGRYRVEVDQGRPCPAFIEFDVRAVAPPVPRMILDSLSCGQRLVLDPGRLTPRPIGTGYRWSTGAQTPALAVEAPGRYRLEIEQGRFCPVVVEYEVRLSNLFAMPNILTANGDALNAALKAPPAYGVPQLRVFNRWGRLVYETMAYHNDWTGAGQPAGVYYYQLLQPTCDVALKGWVEIVR